MIAFCLKNPVSHQELIKRIDEMIRKEIKSQEQANQTALVITLQNIQEPEDIKKLTIS
jgi:hypothetical protein